MAKAAFACVLESNGDAINWLSFIDENVKVLLGACNDFLPKKIIMRKTPNIISINEINAITYGKDLYP